MPACLNGSSGTVISYSDIYREALYRALNVSVLECLFRKGAESGEAKTGWLLDGFPSTQAQVEALKGKGIEVKKLVLVEVQDDDVLLKLATGKSLFTLFVCVCVCIYI